MRLILQAAGLDHAAEIAALRNAVAAELTARHGGGHWSSAVTERGVIARMRTAKVFVAREGKRTVATLALGTRKPWAIDRAYFSACARPLYLTDMAVAPDRQRRGVGRECIVHAMRLTCDWPADAIRLDAYDAEAGAGEFYRKCGFRELARVTYRTAPLIYFELLVR